MILFIARHASAPPPPPPPPPRTQIINGSDILEVLHDYPELSEHINSLYSCQYDKFFRTLSEC